MIARDTILQADLGSLGERAYNGNVLCLREEEN